MLAANDHPSLEPTPTTVPRRDHSRAPNGFDLDIGVKLSLGIALADGDGSDGAVGKAELRNETYRRAFHGSLRGSMVACDVLLKNR